MPAKQRQQKGHSHPSKGPHGGQLYNEKRTHDQYTTYPSPRSFSGNGSMPLNMSLRKNHPSSPGKRGKDYC